MQASNEIPDWNEIPIWDFGPAIDLLKTLSVPRPKANISRSPGLWEPSSNPNPTLVLSQTDDEELSLGNFRTIWEYLASSRDRDRSTERGIVSEDAECVAREVRWRDGVLGAGLENNTKTEQHVIAASTRTRKRAERRARTKERPEKAAVMRISSDEMGSDSAATAHESDQDLDHLRRSPDRKAVIQDILQRPNRDCADIPSPPTSPSPPKESLRVLKKDLPISNPFQWSTSTSHLGSRRNQIFALGNLSPEQRTSKLINRLVDCFPAEAKYLKNKGLIHPEFMPLNTAGSGVHVFIDISNVRVY